MSKGSSRRPTDTDKFDNNFDSIFGKKEPVYKRKQLEEDMVNEEDEDTTDGN